MERGDLSSIERPAPLPPRNAVAAVMRGVAAVLGTRRPAWTRDLPEEPVDDSDFVSTNLFAPVVARLRFLWVVLLAGVLVIGVVHVNRVAREPVLRGYDSPVQWSPMAFSDFLILLAASRFEQQGVIQNYGLANMTVGYPEFSRGWYAYQTSLPDSEAARTYYTHYGPVDSLFVAGLQTVGVDSISTMYLVVGGLTLATLVIWFLTARMLFGLPVAAISTAVIGLSSNFWMFGTTITAHVFDPPLAFSAFFLLVVSWRAGWGTWLSRLALAGAWVAGFLAASNSPEFIPWMLVAQLGYLWAVNGPRRARSRAADWVFSAPLAAQELHFFQVAMALGGVREAITDMSGAFHRRTVGFELAVETGYKKFQVLESFASIDQTAGRVLGLGLVGLLVLLVGASASLFLLEHRSDDDSREARRFERRMLVVLFVGGMLFWVAFAQATVTSAGTMYRTMLPFIGVAIGMVVARGFTWTRQSRAGGRHTLAAALGLAALVAPIGMSVARGSLFDPAVGRNSTEYYGMNPGEVVALGSMVQSHTPYGAILVSNVDFGETGHPRYPFPAIEYYAQRRIEVAPSVADAKSAIANLESQRAALPEGRPARAMRIFVLTEDGEQDSDFGSFAAGLRAKKDVLNSADYWRAHGGSLPVPVGEAIPLAARTYYLYELPIPGAGTITQ